MADSTSGVSSEFEVDRLIETNEPFSGDAQCGTIELDAIETEFALPDVHARCQRRKWRGALFTLEKFLRMRDALLDARKQIERREPSLGDRELSRALHRVAHLTRIFSG